ncbi:MAG: HlyD family efflux transporter periplasmic adaptor subunit [Burkholderiales bacterium]|nr:HlyD family efflux transporter periplasmic adaptor subunit [Burkholderiales bacterium]
MKPISEYADWGFSDDEAEPTRSSPSGSGPSERPAGVSRRLIRWLVVSVTLIMLVIALWVFSTHRAQNVISRNAFVKTELTNVGARFDGRTRVNAGQIIARLDDGHLRAQEVEATANIASLERTRVQETAAIEQERRTLTVASQETKARAEAARSEVQAAKIRVAETQEYWRIRQELSKSGMISAEALREANLKRQLAQEQLAAAQSNASAADAAVRNAELNISGIAIRQQRLGILSSEINAAKGKLARVQADLASTIIKAPTDGMIVRWLVNSGGSIRVGTPIVNMVIGSDRWVEAWIDEDELEHVHIGSVAMVSFPSLPGKQFEGVIERVGVTTDLEEPVVAVPEPRTSRIRSAPIIAVIVRLSNPPSTLLPGISAIVDINRNRL